ncbi:hypothetical protein PUN28_005541 [Cardiocondyla obscurior]|uniref:Secreted protein n=1 Tax=Cardiocondyla obscurior TaxID=286306 RepID=A0AAW2GLF6_9HYME
MRTWAQPSSSLKRMRARFIFTYIYMLNGAVAGMCTYVDGQKWKISCSNIIRDVQFPYSLTITLDFPRLSARVRRIFVISLRPLCGASHKTSVRVLARKMQTRRNKSTVEYISRALWTRRLTLKQLMVSKEKKKKKRKKKKIECNLFQLRIGFCIFFFLSFLVRL